MKKTLILVGVLAMSYTYAQQGKVGVNTEAPQATFEVAPSTANALATATTNEGIIAPKLTKTRIANIATPVEGTLVYATDNTYAGSDAKVAKITEKGYYFYNGTEWVKASGDAAGATLPTTATNGQVLKWNGTAWVAQADANTTYTGSTSVVLSGTSFQRAALTGDVTSAQNNNTVTINNGAVTGAKIANGTITADKLAAGVIPAAQAEVDGIIGNEVTNATASKGLVRAGAGTNADPYTLGVADGGITNAMIANNAINSAKIQDGTIAAGDLANNAVTGAKIANGTITADKLNAMGATTAGQVLKWNGTAWAPAADEVGSGTATPAEYKIPEDFIIKVTGTSYAVEPTDQYITVNGPTAEVTINIPGASQAKGRKIIITNKTSSNVVINSGGSQAIIGSEAPSINKKGTGMILISDGESWYNLINY